MATSHLGIRERHNASRRELAMFQTKRAMVNKTCQLGSNRLHASFIMLFCHQGFVAKENHEGWIV